MPMLAFLVLEAHGFVYAVGVFAHAKQPHFGQMRVADEVAVQHSVVAGEISYAVDGVVVHDEFRAAIGHHAVVVQRAVESNGVTNALWCHYLQHVAGRGGVAVAGIDAQGFKKEFVVALFAAAQGGAGEA